MNETRLRFINSKNLLIVVFVALCFFGFQPGGRFLANEVQWSGDGGGLRFTPNSMIYGRNSGVDWRSASGEIRLSLSIKPVRTKWPRFGILLQVYNKETHEELTIGQWGTNLMVLNDGDYSNRRRFPKIYADMGDADAVREIEILSSAAGTAVRENGKLIGQNRALTLAVPPPSEKNIMIIGNGVNGINPWYGELYRLSISDSTAYDFREHPPEAYAGLVRPSRVKDLDPTILRLPSLRSIQTDSMFTDVFLNFIGFMPLGFLLVLAGYSEREEGGAGAGRARLAFFLIASLLSFLFSLTIEISQVWIPGRDSSMLDLFLNGTGGMAGALIAVVRRPRSAL